MAFCLCLQGEERQQETGVASGDQGRLENPPAAAAEVEGEAAPQGESMGGRERGLLKTTDNLRTLSYRGGKGCTTVGPSLKKTKTPASGGAPRETTESPHKAGELAPCWLRGCGVKTREHLQLGCSPSDRRTRSETVQRVQVKGDKLNRGLAPPPPSRTAKSRTFIDLVGVRVPLLLWKKPHLIAFQKH